MKASEIAEIQKRIVRIVTLLLVFSSLALALSLLPIWPVEPLYILPVILSFLIALLALRKPKLGMTVGSVLVGASLVYHLAWINFISGIAENTEFRLIAVFVILMFFLVAPYSVETHEEAIAIAIGILAAVLLFFSETYFLAIPLILIFAVLYKRAKLALTMSYYAMLSVPIQIMQFLTDYLQGARANVLPVLYGPIAIRFRPIEPFNLEGINNATTRVLQNVAGPYDNSVGVAINMYMNSLPGILTFLVMVFGLISVSAIVTLMALKVLKGLELTTKYARYMEIFLPTITAVVLAQLFWLLSISLRGPTLLIEVNIDSLAMAMGTLIIIGATLPASVIDYMLRIQHMIEQRSRALSEKAQNLLSQLRSFEERLNTVKAGLPISVGSIDGRVLLNEDKLGDIIDKSSRKVYDLSGINEKFEELEKVKSQIENLPSELDISLEEYYTRMVYEYLEWTERLKDLEIETEKTVELVDVNNFKALTVEARVDAAKNVLNAGLLLANHVLQIFKEIYSLIRSLYDSNLEVESPTEGFVKRALEEGTNPWPAMESLLASFQNLERQYGSEIEKSVYNLQSSLSSIISLSAQGEKLLPILGSAVPQLMDLAKKGEDIVKDTMRKKRNIMKVTLVKQALQSTLNISREILQTLYNELDRREKLIESLLPTKEYEWGKNTLIAEKLKTVIDVIVEPSKYNLDVVIDSLYKSLTYIEECIETITLYNKKQEFMLNYPIAELAIENSFKGRDYVYAENLPFKNEYAKEYLKLYSRQNFSEVYLDDQVLRLRAKTKKA